MPKCPTCGQDLKGMIDMSLDNLALIVKIKRASDKLSVRQAAKESGVSASTLSRVENGFLPNAGNFNAICYWLGFNVVFEQMEND